jgi:hypothetical protein
MDAIATIDFIDFIVSIVAVLIITINYAWNYSKHRYDNFRNIPWGVAKERGETAVSGRAL